MEVFYEKPTPESGALGSSPAANTPTVSSVSTNGEVLSNLGATS